MTLAFDSGTSALAIGLGKSGLAVVEVLRERGVRVLAVDEQPRDRLTSALDRIHAAGARFVEPHELPAYLNEVDVAVLSPGVPLTSAVVRAVVAARVALIGEIELAYRLCDAPILAVTGTKGKSTTTALIGHLLHELGKNVRVGGNIGAPLVERVRGLGPQDWVVAEVSSFQLETIETFRPRVAVMLNLAPDHLDRYPSMDEYMAAKTRIVENQREDDVFVGNLDDARVATVQTRASRRWFTLGDTHAGAQMYLRDGRIVYALDGVELDVMPAAGIPLPGAHNVQNAMAALLAVLAIGADPARLAPAVASFRGMPHRLEPVAEIDGVLYVDDSKSTNPGSTLAALHAYDRPVVLIAGGRAKGTSFEELGASIRARVKTLITIGEAAGEFARVSRGVTTLAADSMPRAVRLARDATAPGDVVLLSPACASFDMFRSAEHRGDAFAQAVRALAEPVDA